MTINKKTVFISWFIGLGSGLFISGIILSVLIYTSNKAQPIPIVDQTQQDQQEPGKLEIEKPITKEKPIVQEELIIEKDIPPKDIEMIELEIEPSATAKDITKMLVENGVILDYDEFIAYIVSMDAERSLFHGTQQFPLNSDIETIFKILRP